MLLIFQFIFAWGFISYDRNTFRGFQIVNKGFQCFRDTGRIQDIKFRDAFENIPKVILIPELFDVPTVWKLHKLLQLVLFYLFNLEFTLSIKCNEGVIYGIHYKWLAIDDARIQVLNQFNTKNFEELTLAHVNSNAQKYFISVIAFSFSGPVSFEVQVSEITTKNLKIKIADPQNTLSNLISISYQIILGIDSSFPSQESQTASSKYVSSSFNVVQSQWFLLPFQGFNYDGVNGIKFKKTYFANGNSFWYEMDGGNFQSNSTECCCIPPLQHTQLWMKFEDTTLMTPYEIGQIQIKEFRDSKIDYIQSFKISIQGDTQKVTTLGETYIIIDKGEAYTILNIHVKCYERETLKINLIVPDSSQNNIQNPQYQKCLDSFQEIVISFTLLSTSVAYQELIVSISESECSVSQILFNQKRSQVPLFSIQKFMI